MSSKEIIGRRLILRPIREGDLQLLYEWRNEIHFRNRCSNRKYKVTFQEFISEIRADFSKDRHEQWIILRKPSRGPVGTVYTYNFDKDGKHSFLSLYAVPRLWGSGLGVECLALLAEYLFGEFELYKLYMDVYEYNARVVSALTKAGLSVEGRFRGHRLLRGKRYDVVRFALYPDVLFKHEKLIRSFQVHNAERR
ncbi:GNAT family N-acetyltransferase [Candidatus Campbellbacteria bacterium]|nr:MAG: GNAT family N-acetyltransferase [Candidatus Campbellbacteria bacterium]